ncbi:MAG: hypothetical protein ABIK39_02570 [candidate division WOR-3 bacterium]
MHGNRGRTPINAQPKRLRSWVLALYEKEFSDHYTFTLYILDSPKLLRSTLHSREKWVVFRKCDSIDEGATLKY